MVASGGLEHSGVGGGVVSMNEILVDGFGSNFRRRKSSKDVTLESVVASSSTN